MEDNISDYKIEVTREVILGVNMYGLPVIILIGFLGNIMSFAVFTASRLRHQSSSVYLAFLNFADCLFLLCLLVIQLEWYSVYVMRTEGLCRLVIYLSYVSAFLSVWTVVSFTCERFIVVYFPLMRLVHCTKRRATKIVVSLLVISLVLYNFALWTNSVQETHRGHKECLYLLEFESALHSIALIDTFLTMLIPSVVISLLNLLIFVKVWRFLRKRHQSFTDETAASGSARQRENNRSDWDEHLDGALPMNDICTNREINFKASILNPPCSSYTSSSNQNCQGLGLPIKRGSNGSSNESCRILHPPDDFSACRHIGRAERRKLRGKSKYVNENKQVRPDSTSLGSNQRNLVASALHRHKSRSRAIQLRTTRSLLIISSAFVVLNLPSHAFRIWIAVKTPTEVPTEQGLLWQLCFQFLYYLNFSGNMLMYCVCSKSFRRELCSMLAGIGSKCATIYGIFRACIRALFGRDRTRADV